MPTLLSIDPAVLASIKDFDWAVKSIALGSHMGRRLSKKSGQGMEFSQYRPYSQGDDLRQLDWKMYARSEKFYVKQSDVETNISVTFILDDSASMKYSEEGLSKFHAAKLLAGVLCYVALENGDKVGFAGFPGLSIGYGDRHWKRILFYLNDLDTKTKFESPVIENIRSRELFVVFSDLYDESGEWVELIQKLKSPKNEVIVFHLLGKEEKTMTLEGAIRFKDLETGQEIETDPARFRNNYLNNLTHWIEDLSANFRAAGIDYHEIKYNDDVSEIVNTFLNHRKRLL